MAKVSLVTHWLNVQSRTTFKWDDSTWRLPLSSCLGLFCFSEKGLYNSTAKKQTSGRSPGSRKLQISEAPSLLDMIQRCDLQRPPLATVPALPAPLPKMEGRLHRHSQDAAAHKYPASPGSGRSGIAFIKKLGLDLSSYDFVCGTSFIKALADPRF